MTWCSGCGRHNGVETERRVCEQLAIGLDVFAQLDTEVVEGEFIQGDALAEIFKVENFLAQTQQLFVAITHVLVDYFLDLVILEEVVLERGRDVDQRHAGFDTVLEIDVFIEVLRRPEVHQLNRAVHTPDTVNAPKALDDADGIPVDVVIDEVIAVLKVLPFRNTISGDEQINLTILRHGWHLVALLGTRREVSEDLVEFRFAERGLVITTARHQGDMDTQVLMGP